MPNTHNIAMRLLGFGKLWEVRRTIWPYKDGWGTYNPSTKTIADTGLSKEEAQERCDNLNNSETKPCPQKANQ